MTLDFSKEAEAEASSLKSTLFDWKTNDQNFQRMTCISYVKDNKEEQQKGLLYLSKGSDDTLSSLHVCCAVLPEEYLVESILMQEYEQEGFLYIENIVSGEVLISYGEVVERAEGYNSINLKEMSNYHVIESELNKLGRQIVTGVPKYYISKQMLPAQQLLMAYLTMGFIIVIGLTLYFSLARYYGFRKILFTFPIEEMDIADRREFSDYKQQCYNEVATKVHLNCMMRNGERLKLKNINLGVDIYTFL